MEKIVKVIKEIGRIKRPKKMSSEEKQELLRKLFAKDPSLFSKDKEIQEKIRKRLDWVDGIAVSEPYLEKFKKFSEQVKEKFSYVIWCGMGGSSLFPLVLSQVFTPSKGYPEIKVLDSNDPEEIQKIEKLPLEKCLFVIVSKSGTTIETISHFKYFWEKVKKITNSPGKRFVAITDPGSPLEKLAKEKGFLEVFEHPPYIGGRYAALSVIGLLPACLMGLDLDKIIEYAKKMQEACSPEIPWEYNLGSSLAEMLVEAYIQGKDKLTFITDPLLEPFVLWLEQLIAESLGKECTGIVPVVGEPPGSPAVYGGDRLFIYLTLKGKEHVYHRLISELKEQGFFVKTIILENEYEIFAEVYRWMIAISLCGYFLTLNPFDEPDVVLAKQNTKKILEHFKKTQDFGIEFYLDEETNWGFYYEKTVSIEYPRFTALLKKLFSDMSPWGFVGLLAYLPEEKEIEEIFKDMRSIIRLKKGCATVFGFGPRYLHSSGQLYKGGPILSRFIIFTRKGRIPEQVIPEEGYTFWDQQFAQACGDFKALEENKRQVIMVHFTENYREDLKKFVKYLEKAVSI